MKTKIEIICLVLIFCFLATSVTDAGVSIIGGLTHQKKTNPGSGETYEGSILIKNIGAEPQEVKIYQTDYEFCFDGTNNYGPPGQLKRSNADWISFNPHRLIIPPNDTSTVNYTVKVPSDPNLVGTYWSMLMVEGIPESSLQSSQPEKDKAKVGITQIFRYGIQIITHIGDTGDRKLEFLKTKLVREAEKRIFQVDVKNIGQRWLRPLLWLELYDEAGTYIGKFEGGTRRIYPDTSVRYKIDITDVPNGNCKALMVADCGEDYIFGANYNLKFEE
jgi:hypothetical protein